ncbi:MAG: pyridoxamine 5'-phosphate oxidase family protein [Chloroflexota bacterium]
MLRWSEFAAENDLLARKGKQLLYQHGIGLAYLATVDRDCAPRLHPIAVHQVDGGLYTLLIPSPKRRDLERNPRYALHAHASTESDNEFGLRGAVRPADDPAARDAVIREIPEGFEVDDSHHLYEFLIESALLAEYDYRGQWPPEYTVWSVGSTG